MRCGSMCLRVAVWDALLPLGEPQTCVTADVFSPICNVTGHDLMSLLFNLLDEFLYVFCSEGIVVKDLKITELDVGGFKATASWYGFPSISRLCCLLSPQFRVCG